MFHLIVAPWKKLMDISIQPLGLMNMRLMHQQDHHLGHREPKLDVVRHPHIVTLPHEQLHGGSAMLNG